ncbi:MAG: hypothetical protein V4685_17360 [Bacteroidota bacterium]
MKRIVLIFLAATFSLNSFAQEKEVIFSSSDREDDSEKKGFRKEMLFTGGNINLSFSNYGFVVGATPQLGYSVTSWLDAGILFGFTYSNQRDDANTKYKQTFFTPGAFVRLFPINGFFVSGQFEHNFIKTKLKFNDGSTFKYPNVDVNSLLVGIGYASGREGRNSPYFFFSVSVDILQDPNSPYTDRYNNLLPVAVAGFNIPLFQGGSRRR